MSSPDVLRARLEAGQMIDLRGDGKAGGGLVLVVQAFGAALAGSPDLDVQDWPLFSSARKGANVRAFLRVGRGAVESACQVVHPDIAVLMNEAAGEEVDFAEGTWGALYVINTPDSPEEAARRHRLSGTIVTVPGDDLGARYLGRRLGNVAVFAALVRATELVDTAHARASLARGLAKRRVPERLIQQNLTLYDAALQGVRIATADHGGGVHQVVRFVGYGPVPPGAQAALRSARGNRTAGYGRPGVRIEFADPRGRCNGCTLCVVQCPEGIIDFDADPARGAIVHGARFDDFCKRCRECVAACPLDLFAEREAVARPDGTPEGAMEGA